MGVSDYKEKWGTVRVSCNFGWYDLHTVTHPGYAYIQYKRDSLLWRFNYSRLNHILFIPLNWVMVPVHKAAYRYMYRKAVQKWPHLREEILCAADYSELLVGI